MKGINRRGVAVLAWILGGWAAIGGYTAEPGSLLREGVPASQAAAMLSVEDYLDRVQAVWMARIIGAQLGRPFAARPGSMGWIDKFVYDAAGNEALIQNQGALLDEDLYKWILTLNAFEKYGLDLTPEQLLTHWAENQAARNGGAGVARAAFLKGVKPPDSGHPRHNRYWHTTESMNHGGLYGLLMPGMPNLAGGAARRLEHTRSYAEGADGGVFAAALVSVAFFEQDPREVTRKAARLLHPSTPARQCLDQVMALADEGKSATETVEAVMARWSSDYPAADSAVTNAGLIAAALWFGEGDYLKTINRALAMDYADASGIAAVAGEVIVAMRGRKALPPQLVEPLNGRIAGVLPGSERTMSALNLPLADLTKRSMALSEKIILARGGRNAEGMLVIPYEEAETQEPELFDLGQFASWWTPGWNLERAGHGAPGWGKRGVWGGTFLDAEVLATYPRNESRGVRLERRVKLGENPSLRFECAADPGRAWRLDVYVNNDAVVSRLIDGGKALKWKDVSPLEFPSPDEEYQRYKERRRWEVIRVDLKDYAGQEVVLRLYQDVWVRDHVPGNAYWRGLQVN
ncbi:MAG: hypothetical protein ACE15F_21770 [bacterium]